MIDSELEDLEIDLSFEHIREILEGKEEDYFDSNLYQNCEHTEFNTLGYFSGQNSQNKMTSNYQDLQKIFSNTNTIQIMSEELNFQNLAFSPLILN